MPRKNKAKPVKKWWNRRLPLKVYWPLFLIAGLLLIFSIYNLISLLSIQRQMTSDMKLIRSQISASKADEEAIQEQEYYAETQLNLSSDSIVTPLEGNIDIIPSLNVSNEVPLLVDGRKASFGDSFSGLAYINRAETDMYWDENITAFTFPPVFDLSKRSDCSEPYCGLSVAAVDPQALCLKPGCLNKTGDNRLFFNDRELKLPPALAGQTINSISLAAFGDFWLIGLVTGSADQERGWVYRFDGLAFSPLLTDATNYQILPRYHRGGGRIAFGGSADDFLVLYAGYDGRAFRFRGNAVEEVSRFFGLRVTDGGFMPQIIQIGSGPETTTYVCSITEGKPKIIKLWSTDGRESGGAIDLSPLLFRNDLKPEQILCAVSDGTKKEIAIAAKTGGSYALWEMRDRGFDNSQERRVTSANLNRKTQETIKAAVVADMSIIAKGTFKAYLANRQDGFEAAQPYLWHSFAREGSELYWRLEIPAGSSPLYSPWLGHLNRLDYMFKE